MNTSQAKAPFCRTRVRGLLSYDDKISTSVNNYGVVTTWFSHMGGERKTMTDIVTPNFHKLREAGEIVMTAMTSVTDSFQSDGTGYSLRHSQYSAEWERGGDDLTGAILGYRPGTLPFLVSLSEADQLQIQVSTKVRSQRGRSNANMAEALAERAKTVEMIRSPLNSWISKSRKYSAWRNAALSLANFELMYRYGIKPLVKDLSSVCSNVKSLPPSRTTTRSSESLNKESTSTFTRPFGSLVTCNCVEVYKESYTVRAMSIDEDVAPIFTDLKALGFDAKSLITLPYELVTLSFVADWFINLGDVLGALADTVNLTSKNRGSCLVGTRDITKVTTFVSSQTTPSVYVFDTTPTGIVSQRTLVKQREPGLRAPGLVVNNSFKLNSLTRIADSIALIGQRLLTIKK